ncbi:unnamed protein product [Acanthosepion pharaonis]|uniref:Reverse transcriptase domain-containing protein n=1 Tax=Acanthosepion pharaonis TaxID=158019 RepID=A0A812CCT3_ACAPH|nr:unnamed protein product [Sepia pharaonis]
MSFLIDTGAQLSVVPPSPNFTSVTLRAANGTNIKTFGEQSLTLDIGLRRTYQWIFTVADVKFPILGADFLAHYQLIVDLSRRQLSDSTTKLSNRGIISQLTSTELRIAVPRDNSVQDILDKFPSLIQPFTYTEPAKHSTVHRIRTTEQPVYSKLRRLAPDKYKIARAEFQHMLDLGIIRPSSNPYASPLHMVTKAQQGAWRPCGDYRRLNSQKVPDKYPVPNLTDFAVTLQGASVFTKLDLRKAFHQIPVADEDIPKTAITTPFGLFEFLRMPFGLRNAAQSFQRLID